MPNSSLCFTIFVENHVIFFFEKKNLVWMFINHWITILFFLILSFSIEFSLILYFFELKAQIWVPSENARIRKSRNECPNRLCSFNYFLVSNFKHLNRKNRFHKLHIFYSSTHCHWFLDKNFWTLIWVGFSRVPFEMFMWRRWS